MVRTEPMSRELRIFVVAIVGVVALYFALGAFLPQRWSVESSLRVPATPARVRPLLSDFGSWRKWSTVAGTERADTAIEVAGEPGTVGHQLSWRSSANEAVLRLSRVGADGVDYDFLTRLGGEPELRARGHGQLTVQADQDGALVRWRDESTAEGFAERWFAWFGAQQEAARQFQEASLAGLRVALEGK